MDKISKNEVIRKIIHISFSIIPLSYLWFFNEKEKMLYIVAILIFFAFVIEILRTSPNKFSNLFNYFFGFMLRTNEANGNLTGATWLLIGCIITIIFYDMPIAVSSMLFLLIGDSIAAIAGKFYPIFKIGKKTLFGSFCGFFSSFIFIMNFNHTLSPTVIFFGSIVGMLVELVPTKINDNLTIPIFSGFVMTLLDTTI